MLDGEDSEIVLRSNSSETMSIPLDAKELGSWARVKEFKGDISLAKEHLKRFRTIKSLKKWTNDQACFYFGLSLTGPAVVWLDGLDDSVSKDIKKLEEAFEIEFVKAEPRIVIEGRLGNRKWEVAKGESVEQYKVALQTLGSHLGFSGDDLASYFLRGIPESARAHCLGADTHSLDAYVRRLKLWQSYGLGSSASAPADPVDTVHGVHGVKDEAEQTYNSVTAGGGQTPGRGRGRERTRARGQFRGGRGYNNSQPRFSGDQPGGSTGWGQAAGPAINSTSEWSQGLQSGVTCFTCGGKGHVMRFCGNNRSMSMRGSNYYRGGVMTNNSAPPMFGNGGANGYLQNNNTNGMFSQPQVGFGNGFANNQPRFQSQNMYQQGNGYGTFQNGASGNFQNGASGFQHGAPNQFNNGANRGRRLYYVCSSEKHIARDCDKRGSLKDEPKN